jgi:perilipin-2
VSHIFDQFYFSQLSTRQAMAAELSPVQLQSVNRVYDLPMVKSTIAAVSEQYENLKSKPIVGAGLSKAEQTVYFVTENAAKPVISKFEKPLKMCDDIVCQGLDKLEEKVPAIKKSPEELKTAGWEKYVELKGFGNAKVDDLKTYGYGQVNQALKSPYALAIMKSMDTAMDLTENVVDRYLPESENEAHTGRKEDQNVVQRMGNLSDKMRNRMYKQAMTQLSVLHKRTQEAVDQMKHSVDLIAYARTLEEAGKQKVFNGAEAIQQNAKWLWDELNKEEPRDGQEGPKTVDQQILSVARRATKEALSRYHQITSATFDALPTNVQESIGKGKEHLNEVYSKLSKSSSLKDVSDLALSEMFGAVELVQGFIAQNITPALRESESRRESDSSEAPHHESSEIHNHGDHHDERHY